MACSYSYPIFLTSALGFCKFSFDLIFQTKKVAFAHIAFTFSFVADNSAMAEYSSIRYTCMLSKLKLFWLPLLFIAEAGILSTFFSFLSVFSISVKFEYRFCCIGQFLIMYFFFLANELMSRLFCLNVVVQTEPDIQ